MTSIAVDWSGARVGERRHLWIAEWDPSIGAVTSVIAASRHEAVDHLLRAAERDERLVVGLDFSFSFPEWWLDVSGCEYPEELWGDAARLEGWLAACAPPFWGRPGRPRPPLSVDQQFRLAELAAPIRPKSVFQIGGAGAVGTGSLRGMPVLARLRHAGFAIWPFHQTGPAGGPMAVEVWPRLAAPGVIKRRPSSRETWLRQHATLLAPAIHRVAQQSDDAFDAVVAVIALARRGRPAHPPVADRHVLREGWISGVALPDHQTGQPSDR